jgi:hypothetical protein
MVVDGDRRILTLKNLMQFFALKMELEETPDFLLPRPRPVHGCFLRSPP